jgi:hypothetical protein
MAVHKETGEHQLPLKNPTTNENKYSRAVTAEIKPYSRTVKKLKKLKNILFFHYVFTFTAQKW